jgi:hypothetical protein
MVDLTEDEIQKLNIMRSDVRIPHKDLYVGLAVPHSPLGHFHWFRAFFFTYMWLLKETNIMPAVYFNPGTPLDKVRDDIVKQCQADKQDAIMWWDSDVLTPLDAITTLMNREKDIVSGIYFQKCPPYLPVLRKKNNDPNALGAYELITKIPTDGSLFRVDAAGLGCCLVDMKVYDKLTEPYHLFQRKPVMGEDIYFFNKCNEAGIETWADSSVLCGHLCESGNGILDYLAYADKNEDYIVSAIKRCQNG